MDISSIEKATAELFGAELPAVSAEEIEKIDQVEEKLPVPSAGKKGGAAQKETSK